MKAAIVIVVAVASGCILAFAWLMVAVAGLMERKDDGRDPHDL